MKPTQLRRLAEVRTRAANGTARQIREAAGITLREAAAAVRMSPSTLHRWETGECRPTGARALAWGAMLDDLSEVRV